MLSQHDLSKAATTVERINPRKRSFLGLFGGVDWLAVIAIVIEIVRRIMAQKGEVMQSMSLPGPDRLDPSVQREIDKDWPIR